MLLASLAFSASNFLVFLISRAPPAGIPSLVITWARFLFQALFSVLATLLLRRGSLCDRRVWLGQPGNERKLLQRGIVGFGGLSCWMWMLSNTSLSDAAAITFTNIPLTALFARVLLGEPYGALDAVTGLLGLLGVVLVAQPASLFGEAAPGVASQPLSPAAVGVGLLGACLSSLAFLSIRNLKGEDTFVITLWFAGVGCAISPLLLYGSGGSWPPMPSPLHGALLCGVGVTGFLGQLLLNYGMSAAPAGPAAVMRYMDLINALWMQSLIVQDVPNALKWVGSVLVCSSVVSVVAKARKKAAGERAAVEGARLAAEKAEGGSQQQ